MAETFTFELVSPERLVFSAEVRSVVVPGTDGEFEILAGHSPFLSTIRPGILKLTTAGGEEKKMYVRGGFADANAAGLTLLAEEALPFEQLTRDQIGEAVAKAEDAVKAANDDDSRYRAETLVSQLKEVAALVA